jgi:hypothetical protein
MPLQAAPALQPVALAEDHVSVALAPRAIEDGLKEMVTVGAGVPVEEFLQPASISSVAANSPIGRRFESIAALL